MKNILSLFFKSLLETVRGQCKFTISARKISTIIILSVLISLRSLGQEPSIQWQKSFGGSNYDEMSGSNFHLQTSDGGFVINGVCSSNDGDVTGNHGSYDYWILKADADGNLSWQKSFGGSNYDNGVSAQETTDGGYFLVGYGSSNDGDVSGGHGSYDGWVVKLDADRNIAWQKSLGGSSFDYLWSGQQTSDGGYIVAGETNSSDGDVTGSHGGGDAWIVKLDAVGNIIWQKTLGGSSVDGASSIEQTSDGGYIIGGYSASTNGGVSGNYGSTDYWIVKLGTSGNIIWQRNLGGSSIDDCQSAHETSDGGYIVAGSTYSNDANVSGNHGAEDYWVVKLDATGNITWQKTLGGSGSDACTSAEQTNDGGYIVGGYSNSTDGDVTGNHGNMDYWIVKLDADGNINWNKSLGGSGNDYDYGVVQSNDGGYVTFGFSESNDGDASGNHGIYDYWIVKLSPCLSATTPTIMGDASPICGGSQTTLNISSGDLNSASNWQWYSGGCGSENGGTSVGSGTSINISPSSTTTYYARGEGGCVAGSCGSITLNVTSPLGNPSVFGDQVWNVYAWNAGGVNDVGNSWNTNYSGYYVDTNFNFNTENYWTPFESPSDASGYTGCSVNEDNHSWSAKREGFPCSVYQININGHDDQGQLLINDSMVWNHDGCCDAHPNIWTGILSESSTVEFRVTEGTGGSNGSIELIPLSSFIAINGPTTICPGYALQLMAPNAESFLWSTGETTQGITVNSTNNYSVDVTSNGCFKTTSIQIAVAPLDTPVFGNNLETCPTGSYWFNQNPETLSFTPDKRVASIQWSTGSIMNSTFLSGPGQYSVTISDALGCSATSHITLTNAAVGDPAEFGDHVWKVNSYAEGYGYVIDVFGDILDRDGGAMCPPDKYEGYYIDSTLNFNSQERWNAYSNPSTATGYIGCSSFDDGISWEAKREGFPCGIYQIDILNHAYDADLLIDGVVVWEHSLGCCDSHPNAWTGLLNNSSKVAFRVSHYQGATYGALEFITIPTQGYTFYQDADGDGYGNPSTATNGCTAPAGFVADNTDCNDANSNVNPGKTEICNHIDDNCDGQIDENSIPTYVTASGPLTFCAEGSVKLTANSGTGLHYQWQKDAMNISGATKKTYTAQESGSFQVKETKNSGCNATSQALVVNEITKPVATNTPQGNLNICQAGSVLLQANTGVGLTYQWLKGKTNISSATNSSYTATTKGTYKVIVTNGDCSKTSTGVTVTKSCREDGSVDELTTGTLSIYPNPTTGTFVIDLSLANDSNEEVTIQLYNSIGQLVQQEKTTSADGSVKQEIRLTSGASAGLYLIRIIAGDEVFMKQLVIQR